MSSEPSEQPASVPSASFARLDKHGYLFAHQSYTIRDALYGSVPLLPAAYKTLDTRYFQRLKHLKQLGPSYLVYPGATHTRFSHSIGVYHLTRLALQHLTTQADFEPEVGRGYPGCGAPPRCGPLPLFPRNGRHLHARPFAGAR